MQPPITFNQISRLITQQGIAQPNSIHSESDFKQDLGYSSSDMLEFAGLVKQAYGFNINDMIGTFLTVNDAVDYLNRIQQLQYLAQILY